MSYEPFKKCQIVSYEPLQKEKTVVYEPTMNHSRTKWCHTNHRESIDEQNGGIRTTTKI